VLNLESERLKDLVRVLGEDPVPRVWQQQGVVLTDS